MAHDDRDRSFEKALARHLRPPAPPGLDQNPLGGAAAASCPDSETLAAYQDGSLTPEERILWKQHVMSCEDCQLVLAHLQMPLDVPVHLQPSELQPNGEVLVSPHPASLGGAASPVHIARPSPLHSLRWLWLVPAGALAASLLAWISLHEPKPSRVATSAPVEVAENRQPSISAAPSAQPAPGQPVKKKQAVGIIGGVVSLNRDSTASENREQGQLTPPPSPHALKSATGPSLSMQQQQQQQAIRVVPSGTGAAGAVNQKEIDALVARNMEGKAKEALAKASPAMPMPPPPPAVSSPESSFVADGTVPPALQKEPPPPAPAPAPNTTSSNSQAASQDVISSASETVEVSGAPESSSKARAAGRAVMREASLQNPHVVWAPGDKHAWRIGPAGSLEHSTDKGVSWTPQISGVYTDLIAGFAPSAKVCWIVGNSGTILRTTDGGTHWIKLDSPMTNDFASVHATDALHAWISLAPDHETGLVKTLQTTDGGRTWLAAPVQ
jgi:hypothetical protein